jgi:hypothetical protein
MLHAMPSDSAAAVLALATCAVRHAASACRVLFASLAVAALLPSIAARADAGGAAEPRADGHHQFRLSPPEQDAPIEVLFDFELYDINEIDSVTETFELTGAMTLTWSDPREAFDPDVAGVREKFFQGEYQFNEAATGWYPQVVMLNESGGYEKSGVQLRIKPDGTCVLTEKITAVAEAALDMRSFPFDAHRLDAVFAVLGHSNDEVVLRVGPHSRDSASWIRIPGWSLERVTLSDREAPADTATRSAAAVLSIDVAREASYIRRLITFPMVVIVLLSFSIFWMDKSSLADRNSISLIGVLTGVAFQNIVVSVMPPVSYITLMQGFLFISFLLPAATVPINLAVAELDKRGRSDLGDLIDRRCRWLFPLIYFGLTAAIALAALT